jgi:hypothetical protein
MDEQSDINVRSEVTTHKPILRRPLDISVSMICINEIKVFHVRNSSAEEMTMVFHVFR